MLGAPFRGMSIGDNLTCLVASPPTWALPVLGVDFTSPYRHQHFICNRNETGALQTNTFDLSKQTIIHLFSNYHSVLEAASVSSFVKPAAIIFNFVLR